MGKYSNNYRYAKLADVYLVDLFKLRLSNTNFDGTITSIEVINRRNAENDNEPFAVQFVFKTKQYGKEEQWLIFKSFYIDEWDYIHQILESLNIVPVSEWLLKKNNAIVNLECSNRGYASAITSIKNRIINLYKESIPLQNQI